MTKNKNQEMPEIKRKLVDNKNCPLLTVTITRKLLKYYQFGIYFGFKNNQNYFQASLLGSH